MVEISVQGRPAPQGSKRSFGSGRFVEVSPHVKSWRQDVKAAVRAQYDGDPVEVAVMVELTFLADRPKSHYRASKLNPGLKDGAPDYPQGRPDLDKLVRSTLDAISCDTGGALIKDDSLVVMLNASKLYRKDNQLTGAWIRVTPVTELVY